MKRAWQSLRQYALRHPLLVILTVAALLRGFVLWLWFEQLSQDVDAYRWLAESLARHGVFGTVATDGSVHPTAFRPPLYPWLLSWCVVDGRLNDVCVALLHWMLGLGTVTGTYWLAVRLLPARESTIRSLAESRLPTIAALLVAIDPVLLRQSALAMTETTAVAVGTLVWWVWLRQSATKCKVQDFIWGMVLVAGIVVGFFLRPTFLIWGLALCLLWIWQAVRISQWRPVLWAASVMVVLGLAIATWADRNQRQLGHRIWATSHGGYTLLLGNNPMFYGYLAEGPWDGEAWDATTFHRAWTMRYESDPRASDFWDRHAQSRNEPPEIHDEVADDRLAYEAARATIRRNPGMFAWSCLIRVCRLWSPFPHSTPQRGPGAGRTLLLVGIYYVSLYLACLWGVYRLRTRLMDVKWLAGISLAISLSIVHCIYWSDIRMRAPAVPLIALLATASLTRPPCRAAEKRSPG